ncbi:unnamed protein product [Cylicostephanus goldi]|uniref:Uncharacterized protein n=1 Tax=Cylicostephanus goldi TaxID=71465 RepID=A0A3P6QF87_CYLGO|nr:unnamed protein product [Cylicostephanus goldi]
MYEKHPAKLIYLTENGYASDQASNHREFLEMYRKLQPNPFDYGHIVKGRAGFDSRAQF